MLRLILFFALSPVTLFSQEIILNYLQRTPGDGISLSYLHPLNDKHALEGGITYHINQSIREDNRNNKVTKGMYADDPIEHVGLTASYYYNLYDWRTVRLDFMYNFRASISSYKYRSVVPYFDGSVDSSYIVEAIILIKRPTTLESYVGIMASVPYKRWNFHVRIGGGYLIWTNWDMRGVDLESTAINFDPNDDNTVFYATGRSSEFSGMWSVGVGYRLARE